MYKIDKLPNSGGMFSVSVKGKFIKAGTKNDLKSFIEDTNSKPKEYKGKFYCIPTCTECCHQQVDVSQTEMFRIRRALRKLGESEIQRLKNQNREIDVCPLLDVEKGVCSVYDARPDICKAFGCYTGALACSYNLDVKLEPVEEYFMSMFQETSPRVGKLGVDFTWEKGLV